MILISHTQNSRTYFIFDFDEAKAFERMFDGDFSYATGGYTITI